MKIKNLKLRKKLVAILTTGSIALAGISTVHASDNLLDEILTAADGYETLHHYDALPNGVVTVEEEVPVEQIPVEEPVAEDPSVDTEAETTSNDLLSLINNEANQAVIDYFTAADEKLVEFINNNDIEGLVACAKETIITGLDFIFFEGSINNYKREQVTEETLQIVVDCLKNYIAIVEEIVPGFLNDVEPIYLVALEKLQNGLINDEITYDEVYQSDFNDGSYTESYDDGSYTDNSNDDVYIEYTDNGSDEGNTDEGDFEEEVVEGGDFSEEVVEGGDFSEEVVEGGNFEEEVVEGGNFEEEVVEGGNFEEEIVEGGDTYEEVIDGDTNTYEEVIDGDVTPEETYDELNQSDTSDGDVPEEVYDGDAPEESYEETYDQGTYEEVYDGDGGTYEEVVDADTGSYEEVPAGDSNTYEEVVEGDAGSYEEVSNDAPAPVAEPAPAPVEEAAPAPVEEPAPAPVEQVPVEEPVAEDPSVDTEAETLAVTQEVQLAVAKTRVELNTSTNEVVAISEEAEESVNNYFANIEEVLVNYINNGDYEGLVINAQETVKLAMDFLFFGGKINGYTKEQVSRATLEGVVYRINNYIQIVDELSPGFLTNMEPRYNECSIYLGNEFIDDFNSIGYEIFTQDIEMTEGEHVLS